MKLIFNIGYWFEDGLSHEFSKIDKGTFDTFKNWEAVIVSYEGDKNYYNFGKIPPWKKGKNLYH